MTSLLLARKRRQARYEFPTKSRDFQQLMNPIQISFLYHLPIFMMEFWRQTEAQSELSIQTGNVSGIIQL